MTNKELVNKLRDAIRLGARHVEVAAATGVAESSVYRWLERCKTPKNPLVRAALVKFVERKTK